MLQFYNIEIPTYLCHTHNMAYGKNKLLQLTQSISPSLFDQEQANPPQDSELYKERNDKLVARYYYHTIIQKKLTNEVLKNLRFEFSISTKRIAQVLEDNADAIKVLRKESPSTKWFKSKWPFYEW